MKTPKRSQDAPRRSRPYARAKRRDAARGRRRRFLSIVRIRLLADVIKDLRFNAG
jgi:hypothetical protein